MSKSIEAPAVVHGSDDASRTSWFKQCADDWRHSTRVEAGKGSRWRTLPTPKYQQEHERIFGKKR